jgi:golgi phosphoprotein 3
MPIRHELSLPEEVMLLALHDEKGTVAFGSMYSYAITGGIIAELALRQRIDVERVKRSALVNVRNPTPVGDPLLDEALEKMRTASRRASVQTWVQRLNRIPARQRLLDRLRQRGILRFQEGRLLFVFPRDTYPTSDPAPERDAIERVRRAIFDDAPTDPRTAVLASLAHATGLLAPIFGRKVLKARKQRIKELAAMSDVAGATESAVRGVQEAVQAANAAVIAAVVASSAASS